MAATESAVKMETPVASAGTANNAHIGASLIFLVVLVLGIVFLIRYFTRGPGPTVLPNLGYATYANTATYAGAGGLIISTNAASLNACQTACTSFANCQAAVWDGANTCNLYAFGNQASSSVGNTLLVQTAKVPKVFTITPGHQVSVANVPSGTHTANSSAYCQIYCERDNTCRTYSWTPNQQCNLYSGIYTADTLTTVNGAVTGSLIMPTLIRPGAPGM